jgi:hypothetical protein
MKAVRALIIVEDGDAGIVDPGFGVRPPTDPGYGRPGFAPGRPDNTLPGMGGPVDPGYGRPDWGSGRPGNELPVPPVKPSPPITLPPGVWPPQLPPTVDNTLPPPDQGKPIVIPPDPSVGIENPIVIPFLPPGSALLIALPEAAPKAGAPANTKPAILVQPGKKPVLVYVSAAATPK